MADWNTSSSAAPYPSGSDRIATWAGRRGLRYEWRPADAWFRRWEPHDTLTAPTSFYNVCRITQRSAEIALVEPWYANEGEEPLDRTLLAYVSHPKLKWRAAMRVGEHFLTRVAFIESPPPPTVRVGDRVWDENVATFAASSLEAANAFHPQLRTLLAKRGFRGHVELRPGGLIVHRADLRPTPEHYDELWRTSGEILQAALGR